MAKGEKLIAENRKARHDYNLVERFEAGLVLTGSEVKSLREGRVSLQQAYADVRDGEAWLIGAHIDTYDQAGLENHDPVRDRKLLLKRREIESLYGKVRERGLTLVPTKPTSRTGAQRSRSRWGGEGRARQAARHREARCGSSDRARAEGAAVDRGYNLQDKHTGATRFRRGRFSGRAAEVPVGLVKQPGHNVSAEDNLALAA